MLLKEKKCLIKLVQLKCTVFIKSTLYQAFTFTRQLTDAARATSSPAGPIYGKCPIQVNHFIIHSVFLLHLFAS